jgi:hypothetical protein
MTEFEEAIRERALLWWGDNTFAPKTEQEIIENFWAWYFEGINGFDVSPRPSYH